MILSNVKAKSTIHAIITAVFILVTLLVAGPLFRALPVAALAAMICVAIKDLLLQVNGLPFLWRTSKPDFIIWVFTCLISIFIDLDIGIIGGIIISFLTVIVNGQLTSGTIGAFSLSEDLFHLNRNRSGMKVADHYVIFYFPTQVYFANAEKLKNEMFSKIFSPSVDGDALTEMKYIGNDEEKKDMCSEFDPKLLKYIVLECSAMTYIDLDGANMIKTVFMLYHRAGVTVLLTNCPEYFLNLIEKSGYFHDIPRDTVFYNVHDAVKFIDCQVQKLF